MPHRRAGITATARQVIIRDPDLPLEAIIRELEEAGYTGVKKTTIVGIRWNTLQVLELMEEAGWHRSTNGAASTSISSV
jgi:hypothetical protein